MSSDYRELTECLACGGSQLRSYLDLGIQPLANAFKKNVEPLPEYSLVVNQCQSKACGHSQLSLAVNPSLMFDDYSYISGTTKTLQEHFEKLACYAFQKRVGGTRIIPRVLDIAANDGSLLQEFKAYKCEKLLGIDPAMNLLELSRRKGISVYPMYWSSNAAWELPSLFDIITACNVLAHQDDPADFLLGCARALDDGGILIIEFPSLRETLIDNQFQQCYHEHRSYFSARSFTRLAERCGFRICDASFQAIHGGSYRFTLERQFRPHTPRLYSLVCTELEIGLHKWETYTKFADSVSRNVDELSKTLIELGESGRKIISYGASAKSTVLFNHPGFRGALKHIWFVVDDSPLKQETYSPGSYKYVYSINALKDVPNPVILFNAWNFLEEIKGRLRAIGVKGTTVSFVPEVRIEEFE